MARLCGRKYSLIPRSGVSLRKCGLEIAGALDEKRIRQQWKEIDKLNKKMEGITVLKGTEVNITSAGRLDMPNSALKGMDVVVASVHSGLKNPKDKMTERLVKAMESEHVDIIGHPTGRKINERPPYDIDMAKIFDKAKETRLTIVTQGLFLLRPKKNR